MRDYFVRGAFLGGGVSAFFTNADCVGELAGEADVWKVNVGGFSYQEATGSDGIVLRSVSIPEGGAGAIASVSHYKTNAWVADGTTMKFGDDPTACGAPPHIDPEPLSYTDD